MDSLVHKKVVLKLNCHWIPFDTDTPYNIMPSLFNGSMIPVHLGYDDEDENSFDSPSIIELVDSMEKWMSIPVFEHDLYLTTPRGKFKIPSVVVTKNYDRIKKWEPRITRNNIMVRDNGICQYSGKYIGKNGNIDHVHPISRGGKNTWENMVWCDRSINTKKGDKTPSEAGLKLIRIPQRPNTFNVNYNKMTENPKWKPFLKNFIN